MLIPVIAQYLSSHRRLIIPQMGAFIVKEPGRSVLFSELLKRDDGVLRSLLAARGTSELEAGGEIDRFVFEVRHAIQQGREFPLEGLGVLKPGPNETIAFTYAPQPAGAAGNAAPANIAGTDETARPTAPANPAEPGIRNATQPEIRTEAGTEPLGSTATRSETRNAAETQPGTRPATENPSARKLSAAMGTLYGSSGHAAAEEPAANRSAFNATSGAADTARPNPGTTDSEKKDSGKNKKEFGQKEFSALLDESSACPQFKSLSLPRRSKRDDSLSDSYYGRLPRRPAIEQTVRVKKRSDHFLWIALAAALIALGAIAFGQWCDKFGREGDEVILEHIDDAGGEYLPPTL